MIVNCPINTKRDLCSHIRGSLVALLPFTAITLSGRFLIVFSGFEWTVIMLGFIFSHAACCGGDFGLLSYRYEHKDEDIITIDNMEKGETHFLIKKPR